MLSLVVFFTGRDGLFTYLFTLQLDQRVDTFGEVVTKVFKVVVLIDLLSDHPQSCLEFALSFFPRLLGQRPPLLKPDAAHHRLVQHDVTTLAWLPRRIVAPESAQAMLAQSCPALWHGGRE